MLNLRIESDVLISIINITVFLRRRHRELKDRDDEKLGSSGCPRNHEIEQIESGLRMLTKYAQNR
jgi:hypothetical protein